MSTDKNQVPLDRGIPDLTKREKKKGSMNKVFLWAGLMVAAVFVILFGMMFIKRLEAQKAESKQESRRQDTVEATQRKNFGKDQKEIAERDKLARQAMEAAAPPPSMPAPKDAAQPIPVAGSSAPPPAGRPQQPPPPNRKYLGEVLVKTGSAPHAQQQAQPRPAPVAYAGQPDMAPPSGSNSGGEKLDARLTPSLLVGARAQLREDLTMLLRRGTTIPCVQQTLIVTNHPSLILCKTTKDIYGANGKVLLIERGSTVIGEQRTTMQRGQKTIYAIWSRIETDKGVAIDVNSPASNALGAAGIDAYIDDHWWERFGNAILLTLIGDTMDGLKQYYANRGNDSVFYPSQTQSEARNMASDALKASINIPPTGYSNQGSLLNIFVARDVDFRNVYQLVGG
ncbi:MAG: type IV secretion system protein VirB10 [Betaproteobacteria bacterium]|nr:type IV secretion system protein VirB10 [Betaproteobacteria bacterium]